MFIDKVRKVAGYISIACLIMFAGSIQVHGQAGISAGVNFANVEGEVVAETDSHTGFSVGAFYTMAEALGPLDLRPELYYVRKGYEYSFEESLLGETVSMDQTVKLDYLEVAVPGVYTITENQSIIPQVFAGPSLGINISAKQEVEASGGGETESESGDIEGIASTDFGLLAGFSGIIDVGEAGSAVIVGLRYTLGLSNINDNGSGELTNRGVLLTVGYQF